MDTKAGCADAPVLDALHRLISLLDESMLIPHLAPLIQQEIIVRLLTTFRQHFRTITGMSPVQFQKLLRFAGGAATHARSKHERWECKRPRWLRKRVAVQSRIQATLWGASAKAPNSAGGLPTQVVNDKPDYRAPALQFLRRVVCQ